MNTFVKVMHANTCNCAACASVPTLGIKMPYEEEEKKATKTRKTRQKLKDSPKTDCWRKRFGYGRS